MEYDKNGINIEIPEIYCWQCSGGWHSRMNKIEGKGRCVYIGKIREDGETEYRSQCKKCNYKTPWRPKNYYESYAIR